MPIAILFLKFVFIVFGISLLEFVFRKCFKICFQKNLRELEVPGFNKQQIKSCEISLKMEDYKKTSFSEQNQENGLPAKERKILYPEKKKKKRLAILINQVHFVERRRNAAAFGL
jgi:hypothetical protein